MADCDGDPATYPVSDSDLMSSGKIYGIYFAWVFGIGVAMFFPYNLLRHEKSEQGRTKLVWYAGVFGAAFLL